MVIKNLKKHLLLCIFCILYILLSLATYKDFGITADEEVEYSSSEKLITYYFPNYEPKLRRPILERHLPENSTYFRGHIGIRSLLNFKGYFEWYHLLNMLFGMGIFVIGYFLVFSEYKSQKQAILAPIMLFLTPRLIGHIPANPKDFPFAQVYLLGLLLIYLKPKTFITGIAIGLAASYRIVGLTLIPIYLIFHKDLRKTLVISLISILTMFILLPILQEKGISGFLEIVNSGKSFAAWDNQIYYFGKFLSKTERPWHYLFTWIFITTPFYILIFYLCSFGELKEKKLLQLLHISVFINFLAYLILKPVVYNGLRHFLYLLPQLVLISTITIIQMRKEKWVKILISASFLYLCYSIIKIHPYEYTYFNFLDNKFEKDYWGTSYKEMTEYLVEIVKPEDNIKVYACSQANTVQYYSEQKFEIIGDLKKADYAICRIEEYKQENILGEKVYITNNGFTLLGEVRRLK